MNVSATKAQKKVSLLRALIDHPRTGEGERDAARRMLQRVLDNAKTEGVQINDRGWVDHRVYGAKWEQAKNLRLTDIAKLMREDIKVARKIGKQAAGPGVIAVIDALGTMPTQIKMSVTTEYYSGGGSIDITVKNIPDDWGFVEAERYGRPCTIPSAAFEAVLTDLRVIHAAYNYDGSDILTDYFDQRYLGCVDYERPYHRR